MIKRRDKEEMKKLLLVLLAVGVVSALVFSGCPGPAPPKEPTVLKLVSFKPDVPPDQFFEHMLIDKVKAKSNGELIIEWVGGPEAIPPYDTPGAVQSGTINIASVLFGAIDTIIPGWECLGFSTITIEEFRKSEAYDIAAGLCEDKGIYFLGWSTACKPNRMMAVYSKTKIAKLEDFTGMKFAVQGSAYAKLLETLGAVPSIIPMADYFTAMERGTVDAFHIGVPGVIMWGCKDVTNYMLDEIMGSCSSAFLVNLEVWNSLPKNLQDIMTEAMIEDEIEAAVAWEDVIAGVKKELSDAGVEIVKFSPEDSKRFYDIYVEATWGHVMPKNPELVAKFKEIIAP